MLSLVVADALPTLAQRLCHSMAQPLDDPMVSEWVAVPSAGMQQWLALELAKVVGASSDVVRDGISANIEFVRSAELVRVIFAADDLRRGAVAASGSLSDSPPDPWNTESMMWSVLGVVAGDPALAGRAGTSSTPLDPAWARRVARRFDRYHVHRPDMIRLWAQHHDVDAQGAPLGPDHQWQAELWRAVRAGIDEASPPERLLMLLEDVRGGRLALRLPQRLSLFGFTSLPGGRSFLQVVDAVARHHDVELLLLDPSPATSLAAAHAAPAARTRAEERSGSGHDRDAHPLVESWARVSRETMHLAETGSPNASVEILSQAPTTAPASLLAALQADIRSGSRPRQGYVPDEADRSVELHVCQGPVRQVEVLRDALLHLFAEDDARAEGAAALTEEDVVVVCPDLDRFAPIIRAVFGEASAPAAVAATELRAPALRYALTDRRAATTNPVLDVLFKLLDLVTGPVGADAVLELCASPAVQTTFGLDPEALDTVHRWVDDFHVSWGLDATHRVQFGAPASLTSNTWQRALDALLLGTAISGEDALAIGGVLVSATSSAAPDTVGQLADLVARLRRMSVECETSRPMHEWTSLIRGWIDELVTPDDDTTRGLEAVRRMLGALDTQVKTAAEQGAPVLLGALAARRVLDEHLGRASSRDSFFLGGVTVTSLESLRWVPHKVVAILGLDHAALGSPKLDGDDLSAVEPLIGDVDRRAETRQAVLEAVLAAEDHLLVLRDGTDLTKGADVPESVMVTELREALLATVVPTARHSTAERIELVHPRHSSDERCFQPGRLGRTTSWGFDPIALAGAAARAQPVQDKARWQRVARTPATSVDLEELSRFLSNPTATYVRSGLELHLPKVVEDSARHLPVELAGLENWALKQRLLDRGVDLGDGAAPVDRAAIEVARGVLPVAGLGTAAFNAAKAAVEPILTELERRFPDGALTEPVVIDVTLDDGTHIGGVVNIVPGPTPGPVSISSSNIKVTDRLKSWLELMALVAVDPTRPWRTTLIRSKGKADNPAADVVELTATDPAEAGMTARDALGVVVELWHRGLQEPIPLFPSLSEKLAAGESPKTDKWHAFDGFSGDADNDAAQFIYGDLTLSELLDAEALPTDPAGNGRRARRYADALWKAVDGTCRNADGAHDAEGMP